MRHKKAPKRTIQPDPKYGNLEVAKFINYLMRQGRKMLSERIVYTAFDLISEKTKQNPVEVFESALKKVSPSMEVKSRRVGGANYQIPTPVRSERRQFLACQWMLEAARKKAGHSMSEKLASEIMAAAEGAGDAVKKKNDVQRMADANRAFAHFAR